MPLRRSRLAYSLASAFFLVGLIPATSRAETAPKVETGDPVMLVKDQHAHALRILIDGREVATIDKRGLTVTGDVYYTGVITDLNANPSKPLSTERSGNAR